MRKKADVTSSLSLSHQRGKELVDDGIGRAREVDDAPAFERFARLEELRVSEVPGSKVDERERAASRRRVVLNFRSLEDPPVQRHHARLDLETPRGRLRRRSELGLLTDAIDRGAAFGRNFRGNVDHVGSLVRRELSRWDATTVKKLQPKNP